MLRSALLIAAMLAACVPTSNTTPLRNCEADDPTVDCCTESDQCDRYFGPDFAICTTPGDQTGRCSECTIDEHCDLDSFCETDAAGGPYCAPLANN